MSFDRFKAKVTAGVSRLRGSDDRPPSSGSAGAAAGPASAESLYPSQREYAGHEASRLARGLLAAGACEKCRAPLAPAQLFCTACGERRAGGLGNPEDWEKTDRKLGQGSFGVVWLGREVAGERRQAALKYIEYKSCATDAERDSVISSAISEALKLKALRHPNIVEVYSVYVDRAALVVAMELCPRGTLWDMMDGPAVEKPRPGAPPAVLRALPEAFVRDVTRGVCEALAYIHARGIVHRDLKPMNVMMADDARTPKLGDFGLAHDMADGAAEGEMENMAGTPLFMAPELFHFFHKARGSTAVDVWSLGLTVECLLSGVLPFWSVSGKGLWKNIRAHKGKIDYEVHASLPALARNFVMRCTASDPAARATATELLADPWLAPPGAAPPPMYTYSGVAR